MSQQYQHWKLNLDSDKILWLIIDRQDSSVNSLNRAVIEEFNQILDDLKLATDNKPNGVVICSGKKSGFIFGADIDQFDTLKNADEAFQLIRQGQLVFDKLANLPMPTCAMIEGPCLGGGFELALACRYRVAEDGSKTKIGLPEVNLGIHPGWGGTVRLPHLIGALNAMPAILTGKFYNAKAAMKLGMIDVAVPKRHLENAARKIILEKPAPHQAKWWQQLTNSNILRPLLAKRMRSEVERKVRQDQYPAPFAVIDNWVKQGGAANEQAYITEAKSISDLLVHATSRNLVRVFNLQNRLKNLVKNSGFKPTHVHVIGAGTMGGDIAAWCALRGLRVTLQDREARLIGPAIKRAAKLFKKKLKDPRLVQEAMDRLLPDQVGLGVSKADVIIEAIFEDCETKQKLFKDLEKRAKPDAILATNTSSIPIDSINSVLVNPARLVGIHFFNPVAQMMLVEVVQGSKTDKTVLDNAISFVRKIDKLPLPVKSSPGFLVNRLLMPYLMEAVTLHTEGVPLAVIDKAAVDFGMPMGPVELADTVGLDICLAVAKYLTSNFGGTIPSILIEKVNAGATGKKAGKGFYDYAKPTGFVNYMKNLFAGNKAKSELKPIKPSVSSDYIPPTDLTNRLVYRLVNEAYACLREGVVSDADLLDAGMIFGTGFAPFRGGPMHYSKSEGLDKFRERLTSLRNQYGDRFKLDTALTT